MLLASSLCSSDNYLNIFVSYRLQNISILHWFQAQEVFNLFSLCISSSSFLLQVTCVVSSQSSLLDPLDHPHWSLFLNHQLTAVSRSQTAPSSTPPHTCETNFLLLFVFFITSSPSSYSDPRPLVDLSRGVFHSRLTFFSKSFPP